MFHIQWCKKGFAQQKRKNVDLVKCRFGKTFYNLLYHSYLALAQYFIIKSCILCIGGMIDHRINKKWILLSVTKMEENDFLLVTQCTMLDKFLFSESALNYYKREGFFYTFQVQLHHTLSDKWMNCMTVRPWDTRPLHTQISQIHGFLLGPETFNLHWFCHYFSEIHGF